MSVTAVWPLEEIIGHYYFPDKGEGERGSKDHQLKVIWVVKQNFDYVRESKNWEIIYMVLFNIEIHDNQYSVNRKQFVISARYLSTSCWNGL